ncbi:P-type DNA transfer ATPase VirB11 [Campylobacter jejuni]|nr:P-type DNA transfer ATPase VirB11 [Campylobacter jejuni]
MSITLDKYTQKFFGEFLKDDNINEICYNGDNKIWVQNSKGLWECIDTKLDFEQAGHFATASASFKKDKIDVSRPILSCILVGGERMQIVIPPATKSELFEDLNPDDKNKIKPSDEELIKLYEARDYQNFISKAVSYGKNIIIAGETGSGKTTFMKTLIDFISLDDRIITIEDVEEIKFYEHKNFVQLFYPSEAKSTDFLNSATLLKSCLRMKPDRILLAELRGAETYDFINVLASGHGGSITSCHAGSPEETFTRLALMTLQNPQGQCVPFEIIQKTLKDLIDIVVHIHAHHGKRRISGIYFKEMER